MFETAELGRTVGKEEFEAEVPKLRLELLEAEKEVSRNTRSKFLELFTIPRNRRATLASSIVMFMYVCASLSPLAFLYIQTLCFL